MKKRNVRILIPSALLFALAISQPQAKAASSLESACSHCRTLERIQKNGAQLTYSPIPGVHDEDFKKGRQLVNLTSDLFQDFVDRLNTEKLKSKIQYKKLVKAGAVQDEFRKLIRASVAILPFDDFTTTVSYIDAAISYNPPLAKIYHQEIQSMKPSCKKTLLITSFENDRNCSARAQEKSHCKPVLFNYGACVKDAAKSGEKTDS